MQRGAQLGADVVDELTAAVEHSGHVGHGVDQAVVPLGDHVHAVGPQCVAVRLTLVAQRVELTRRDERGGQDQPRSRVEDT